jgi:magnesium transporter
VAEIMTNRMSATLIRRFAPSASALLTRIGRSSASVTRRHDVKQGSWWNAGCSSNQRVLSRWDAASRSLVADADPIRAGWIHAAEPAGELALLRERFGVPAAFIDHSLDVEEVARIDRDGSARLIVVRVPASDGLETPSEAMAIGIVLVRDLVVTIARHDGEIFSKLAARSDLDPAHHERFVLLLLMVVAEQFLALVRRIDREVAELEDELQASLRNAEVYGLLRYQKVLVHFATALGSDQILIDRLLKDPIFEVRGPDLELLEDVEVELQQAAQMTSTSGNILGEMMDAFASIISNNLNVVMKVMAAITIILALPALVATFYGMNVQLPGQKEPAMFALLILISTVISAAVAGLFMRRRWL